MGMRVYKVYVNNAGVDADAAIYAEILRAGTIVGIQVGLEIDSITDNSYFSAEFSTQANGFQGQNNSQGDFAAVVWRANGAAPVGHINQYLPLAVPIQYGQRVYVNIGAGGVLVADLTAYIWVQE